MKAPAQTRARRLLRQAAQRPLSTQEAERLFRLFTPAARDPADQALRARRALRRLQQQALLQRTPQGWIATDQGRALCLPTAESVRR